MGDDELYTAALLWFEAWRRARVERNAALARRDADRARIVDLEDALRDARGAVATLVEQYREAWGNPRWQGLEQRIVDLLDGKGE